MHTWWWRNRKKWVSSWATIHREKFDAIKRSIVAGTSTPPSSLLLCCCSWGCPQGPLPGLSIGSDLMTFTELLHSSTQLRRSSSARRTMRMSTKCRTCTTSIENYFLSMPLLRFFFERNSSSILLLNYILLWVVLIVSNTSWYTDMALNWCVPKKDI